MSEILLCTHDPMLVKGIYGVLRDEGYKVALAESPAQAVQMILKDNYAAAIIDSHAFGISVDDAVRIIKSVSPDLMVVLVGNPDYESDAFSIRMPLDLEKLRSLVHIREKAGGTL